MNRGHQENEEKGKKLDGKFRKYPKIGAPSIPYQDFETKITTGEEIQLESYRSFGISK